MAQENNDKKEFKIEAQEAEKAPDSSDDGLDPIEQRYLSYQ
jgi:hypothetical protein